MMQQNPNDSGIDLMKVKIEQLQLSLVQGYECRLWRYEKSHSEVAFCISHIVHPQNSQILYLVFQNLIYLDVPIKWKNANISLGHERECYEILNIIQIPNAQFLAESGYFYLFKFLLPNQEIKLIASNMFLTQELAMNIES